MIKDVQVIAEQTNSRINRDIVPFIVCGDLRNFDSDMSYSLISDDGKHDYEYLEVVQQPISPAYKEILEKTKSVSLKHQNYLIKEETM